MSLIKKRILIVDDDKEICTALTGVLAPFYDCEWVSDSTKAMVQIENRLPHLILLDFQMPVVMGTEICIRLKAHRTLRNIPVIFISGVASVDEKIHAFECGANDFILKPFHVKEMLVRIQARLTPPSGRMPKDLVAGNLRLNELSRRVYIDSSEVLLTQRQFDILRALMMRPNELITRQECMEIVWGRVDAGSRKIDSHISLLKAKLKTFKGRIVAIAGEGYCLEVWE